MKRLLPAVCAAILALALAPAAQAFEETASTTIRVVPPTRGPTPIGKTVMLYDAASDQKTCWDAGPQSGCRYDSVSLGGLAFWQASKKGLRTRWMRGRPDEWGEDAVLSCRQWGRHGADCGSAVNLPTDWYSDRKRYFEHNGLSSIQCETCYQTYAEDGDPGKYGKCLSDKAAWWCGYSRE